MVVKAKSEWTGKLTDWWKTGPTARKPEVVKPWHTGEWWLTPEKWTQEEIEELCKEEYARLDTYPWFERGKNCQADIFQQRDYHEELVLTYGSEFGAAGLGKLRKVFLSRPMEYEINPVFEEEPAYYQLYENINIDLKTRQKFFDDLVNLLKGEGIEIGFLNPPDTPLGPYGFLRNLFANGLPCCDFGAIELRAAMSGWNAKTRWRDMELMRLGVPVYFRPVGKGCGELTACYIAQNTCVIGTGYAANEEAVGQLKYALELAGDEVFMANTSGFLDTWLFPAGGTTHLNMVLSVADLGLAVVYPSFIDYRTIAYLRSTHMRFIEVPPDEYPYAPNFVLLEPGKVLIAAQFKQTIKKLRNEGVTCIEIDAGPYARAALANLDCMVGKWLRDPGPTKDDLLHQ